MKEAEIRKYAELMKELGITGLEITDNDFKVRLERYVQGAQVIKDDIHMSSQQNVAAPVNDKEENCDYISVKSPIVGVFYAAPAEDAKPYVSVGDNVTKGQTLCIVEAMKLMNEITADDNGVISEVCVTNGQIVEYGTELFRIKR